MAERKQVTMTSAVAVALLLAMAAASVSAGTVCGVDLGRLKDACGSYIARGSREARPSGQCCDVLRKANLTCLCKLKRAYGSFDGVDAGRAMQIPGKCGIRGVPRWC